MGKDMFLSSCPHQIYSHHLSLPLDNSYMDRTPPSTAPSRFVPPGVAFLAVPEPFLILPFQFQSQALRLDSTISVEVSSHTQFGVDSRVSGATPQPLFPTDPGLMLFGFPPGSITLLSIPSPLILQPHSCQGAQGSASSAQQ